MAWFDEDPVAAEQFANEIVDEWLGREKKMGGNKLLAMLQEIIDKAPSIEAFYHGKPYTLNSHDLPPQVGIAYVRKRLETLLPEKEQQLAEQQIANGPEPFPADRT